ncbi:hypothetical protein JHS3_13250 [Jeongeupia sp. HS-3]|uniref:hypothetical protein n=1 Tax=Jeongeupia sp. HS-3 TaxID=1009682 RepID=UPI0018A56B90|nr:hypothetical protein [Jeongeupia sp. HS-3]BCL75589.1 hypothetical protein JHS3_13250 [Jeongeupia sp. HS-3]
MRSTTGETYGFLSQIFQLYLMVIDRLLQTPELSAELRYVLILVYSCVFVVFLSLFFWFAKFLLSLIAKGFAAIFLYLTASLDNPRSLPYVSILALVQSIPWYFSLLVLILGFCGLAALITDNPVWSESFKYIMGATVGSLIGVVQKKEQVEVETRLYGLLERETTQSLDASPDESTQRADK